MPFVTRRWVGLIPRRCSFSSPTAYGALVAAIINIFWIVMSISCCVRMVIKRAVLPIHRALQGKLVWLITCHAVL